MMAYNPDLTAEQKIDLLDISKELTALHTRVHKITTYVQRHSDRFDTSGQLIDIQMGISDVMMRISKALFT